MEAARLYAIIDGNATGAIRAYDVAEARGKKAAAGLEKTGKTAAASMAKTAMVVGMGITAVGAATIASLYSLSTAAGSFNSQMEMLRTQAGASQAEVDNMSKAVLALSGQVATSPEELAKGLYHIESAGFRGKTALDALRVAAEGAKIGNADLESVTNAMNAVMVAGVPEAKNLGTAMGELNAIVGSGDMRMQDLADAMGTGILATAKAFGLGLKDVGGALATFGDNNIRGSQAATKLRMAISMMGAPSGPAIKALNSIGLSSTQLADDMRSKGLVFALQDLKTHLTSAGLTATQQAQVISHAFGGGRTSSAVMILLQQLDRVKTKEAEIVKGAKDFPDAWQATQSQFKTMQGQFVVTAKALGISVGEVALPIFAGQIKDVTTELQKLLVEFNKLPPDIKTKIVGNTIKTAEAALVLGPALMIGSKIASTIIGFNAGGAVAGAAATGGTAVSAAGLGLSGVGGSSLLGTLAVDAPVAAGGLAAMSSSLLVIPAAMAAAAAGAYLLSDAAHKVWADVQRGTPMGTGGTTPTPPSHPASTLSPNIGTKGTTGKTVSGIGAAPKRSSEDNGVNAQSAKASRMADNSGAANTEGTVLAPVTSAYAAYTDAVKKAEDAHKKLAAAKTAVTLAESMGLPATKQDETAIGNVVKASKDAAFADGARRAALEALNGASGTSITAMGNQRQELASYESQLGPAQAKVAQLTAKLKSVPKSQKAEVRAEIGQAQKNVDAIKAKIASIHDKQITIEVSANINPKRATVNGKSTQILMAHGGIVDGPVSGYPVTMHGRERVIPMDGSANALAQWRAAGKELGAFGKSRAASSGGSASSGMTVNGDLVLHVPVNAKPGVYSVDKNTGALTAQSNRRLALGT